MKNLAKQQVYTMEDWDKDGDLSSKPYQEVEHAVYSDMYSVLPPLPLEKTTETILQIRLGVKFIQSFCVGGSL